jgi:hypothetical protein
VIPCDLGKRFHVIGKSLCANVGHAKVFYCKVDNKMNVMETKELIFKEIEVFPEPYLEEILDFIKFLKEKSSKNKMETAILSELVLSRDWSSSEEDKAWEDL